MVFDNGGTLNVMTLNLLFSEYDKRSQRLKDIASFIARNNIHIVGLQEVVGGRLDEILAFLTRGDSVDTDTAHELKKILKNRHGLNFDLRTAFSNGVPSVLSVYNAVLSRCKIVGREQVKKLPKTPELEIAGREIELGRSVLMTRAYAPGLGYINVYNTHLCADCSNDQRLGQAKAAMKFVNGVEQGLPSKEVLFLGDFNINVPRLPVLSDSPSSKLYRLITGQNDFVDSYARFVNTNNLCIPRRFELGCTYGVSNIADPFGATPTRGRIDYIFGRGPLVVKKSNVVFNPRAKNGGRPPGVSDHSAVVTRYRLP